MKKKVENTKKNPAKMTKTLKKDSIIFENVERKFAIFKKNKNIDCLKVVKNRVKKCRNCKQLFDLENKKIYFPVIPYIYCENCKFIISKTSYNNSLSCSRYQLQVINLYNQNFSKSKDDPLKLNDIEEGSYNGCPGHAAKKAHIRFWRKLRKLAEADIPGIAHLINIHNKISADLINEILMKSLESLRYANLINKIQKIFSQEKQPFSIKMIKIGRYDISPIYDLNITRQSKIIYKPIKRQSKTKLFHSDFLDGVDIYEEDTFENSIDELFNHELIENKDQKDDGLHELVENKIDDDGFSELVDNKDQTDGGLNENNDRTDDNVFTDYFNYDLESMILNKKIRKLSDNITCKTEPVRKYNYIGIISKGEGLKLKEFSCEEPWISTVFSKKALQQPIKKAKL